MIPILQAFLTHVAHLGFLTGSEANQKLISLHAVMSGLPLQPPTQQRTPWLPSETQGHGTLSIQPRPPCKDHLGSPSWDAVPESHPHRANPLGLCWDSEQQLPIPEKVGTCCTDTLSSSAREPGAGGEDVPAVFGVQLLNMKAALAAQPAAFYLFIYTSNVKIRHSLLWNEAQQLFHPRRFPQFCSSKPQQAPCWAQQPGCAQPRPTGRACTPLLLFTLPCTVRGSKQTHSLFKKI